MPAGPSHIYIPLDAMDRSVYMDNGILAYSAAPRPLIYTPDGWKEISILDQRNMTYFTLDINFTIPLNFVGDGAQILKTWFSTKGTEVPLFLAIMEQRLFYDGTNYYYYYTLLYKSQINFSTIRPSAVKVSVNMLDQGFAIQLKNKASTTYQYNIADNHLGAPIYWDGITLQESGNFELIDGVTLPASAEPFYDFFIPLAFLDTEGVSTGISFQNQTLEIDDLPGPPNTANWFAKSNAQATGPITIHPKGSFSFTCKNNDNIVGSFEIQVQSSLGQTFSLGVIPNMVVGQKYTVILDQSITLAIGEALYLIGRIRTGTADRHSWTSIQFDPGSEFSVIFNNRFKASFVKAFDIFEIFSLLVSSMTNGAFIAAPSTMLSRLGLKIAITSGDGIRGLDAAILKITWNNLWSFTNMYEDAGLYVIGNQVHMERKEDCIDFTSFIDIGQVSDLEWGPANDVKFNLLKIGSVSQDYGQANGKDEFNTTLEMSVAVTSISTEVDFLSDVRVDGFGAEYIRTGLDGKDTTDNTADGQPFAIVISDETSIIPNDGDPIEAYTLDRTLNPYATGLIFPDSVFNLKLAPKQCLYRKGNYLSSCLDKLEMSQLVFQNLDKNQALEVRVPGQRPVIEKANETIGELGIPYFKPILFDCTGQASSDIIQTRKKNPRSVIRFSVDNISYVCLPMKEGIQPTTNAAQAFEFLAGPDNDITLLNNYYGE